MYISAAPTVVYEYQNLHAIQMVVMVWPPVAMLTVCAVSIILLILWLLFKDGAAKRALVRQAQMSEDSRLQLQTVFDTMTEAIVVMDMQHNIVHMNRMANEFLGLPEDSLSSQGVRERFKAYHTDGTQLTTEQWPGWQATLGHYCNNLELRLENQATGHTQTCEVSTRPILSGDGVIRHILINYRDISERQQATSTRLRLAAIVESSDDAIIGEDVLGNVTSWNKGAESIFGYTEAEMLGQPISRIMPPGREHDMQDFLARIQRGGKVEHEETQRLRKDGTVIEVSLSISPIRDAAGQIIGASKNARDITRLRQLERQLRQSQKMEAIGQLTGGIAHDFNNLLAVILGNLDLLESTQLVQEEALRHVKTAQKAAVRGADLTRRLLAFSSKEDLRPTLVDLQSTIADVAEMAARALGPDIRLEMHMDETIPQVNVDSAGLENALLNLVVNARDAMPKGGPIGIAIHSRQLEESYPSVQSKELKPGNYACITVSDNGEGMTRETMERAFEPFFTTKSRSKGTGLGLAMVYGFARQSGGSARIYSEPGYGTTVTLFLPFADQQAMPRTPSGPHLTTVRSNGKVLVVDDDSDLIDIALAYLSEMGYGAYHTTDGETALRLLEEHEDIALMLTDIIMPGGMSGAELAQRAQELRADVRILYSSGFPADALEERSVRLADRLLLRKPYTQSEFKAMIRSVMDRE